MNNGLAVVAIESIAFVFALAGMLYRGGRMYFNYVKNIGYDREGTMTRASHGVFMLLASCYIIDRFGLNVIVNLLLSLDYKNYQFYLSCIVPALIVWGTGWSVPALSWRARGPRDGRLIYRYLMQLVFGGLAWVVMQIPELNSYGAGYYQDLFLTLLHASLRIAMAWFLITGTVKLLLILRGMPRAVEPPPIGEDDHVYGRASFADVNDALKGMRD